MKRLSFILSVIFFVLPLFSCGAHTATARELLFDFKTEYGASGIIYSPEIAEGEEGYIDEDFFKTLFDSEPDFESDYAVLLFATLDGVFEAAVFVCYDNSSLLYAESICRSRLSLLSGIGYDTGSVIRRGKTVFYSTMPDSRRAEKIWRDINV